MVRVADHAKQAFFLRCAVDGELGVEDFVAAVLAVGLGEHHQLNVGRVALQAGEGVDQIVDFIVGQGKAPVLVGFFQRLSSHLRATAQHLYMLHRRRVQLGEQRLGLGAFGGDRLGHPVVQQIGHRAQLAWLEGGLGQQAGFEGDAVFDQPLHPVQGQAAVVRDVGGFGGPGRDGAQARHHPQRCCTSFHRRRVRRHCRLAVGQQLAQTLQRLGIGYGVEAGQVHEMGGKAGDFFLGEVCQTGQQLRDFEIAERVAAVEKTQVQGHGGGFETGRHQAGRKPAILGGHTNDPPACIRPATG